MDVVVTDDNPRHEDGEQIVAEILAGMKDSQQARVMRARATGLVEITLRPASSRASARRRRWPDNA